MLNSLKMARQFLRRSDAAAYVTAEYGFPPLAAMARQAGGDRWGTGVPEGGTVSGL